MHKQNVNIQSMTASVMKHAVTPFAFEPTNMRLSLMPQTVINRRGISRYGAYRWKLLTILKENS